MNSTKNTICSFDFYTKFSWENFFNISKFCDCCHIKYNEAYALKYNAPNKSINKEFRIYCTQCLDREYRLNDVNAFNIIAYIQFSVNN